MNLIAVHLIQRRDAKGKRADVAPKATFEASGDEAEYLLRVGAARKAPGQTLEHDAEPETEKAPVQGTEGGGDDTQDLAEMTKAQLVQFAADHEIEIDSGANKAEVLDTIDAALRADDDLV